MYKAWGHFNHQQTYSCKIFFWVRLKYMCIHMCKAWGHFNHQQTYPYEMIFWVQLKEYVCVVSKKIINCSAKTLVLKYLLNGVQNKHNRNGAFFSLPLKLFNWCCIFLCNFGL